MSWSRRSGAGDRAARRRALVAIAAVVALAAGCSASGNASDGSSRSTSADVTSLLALSSTNFETPATSAAAGGSPGSTPATGTSPMSASSSSGAGAGASGRENGSGRAHGSGRSAGSDPGSNDDGASGRTGLAADVAACRLLTPSLADRVVAPLRTGRSTDVPSVCAYTAGDGKTVLDIGDTALARGQSARSVIDGEAAGLGRSGYRTSRITVGGHYPGVVQDGRPDVVRVVWVQRGRDLDLTVSPAGSAAVGRLVAAASSISAVLGTG